jgi:hypothetical protein
MKSLIFPALLFASVAPLTSCSSVKTTMARVSKPVTTFAKEKTSTLRNFRVADLWDKDSDVPPVVKVRRKDLREITFGDQKVLAWTRSQQYGGGVFYFPADFDPSKLPVGGPLPSSGILPPLNPEGDFSNNLPDDVAGLPDLTNEDFEPSGDE